MKGNGPHTKINGRYLGRTKEKYSFRRPNEPSKILMSHPAPEFTKCKTKVEDRPLCAVEQDPKDPRDQL
jgi:hypothetical protein